MAKHDDRSRVTVTALLRERPLCASCISDATILAIRDVLEALHQIASGGQLQTERDVVCPGCRLVGQVHSITHR